MSYKALVPVSLLPRPVDRAAPHRATDPAGGAAATEGAVGSGQPRGSPELCALGPRRGSEQVSLAFSPTTSEGFVLQRPAPTPSHTMFSAPFDPRALKLSLELSRVSLERDSLSRELMRAIRQKVALTQELEAWQVRGRALSAGGLVSDRTPPHTHRALPPTGRHAGGDRAAAALPAPEGAQ